MNFENIEVEVLSFGFQNLQQGKRGATEADGIDRQHLDQCVSVPGNKLTFPGLSQMFSVLLSIQRGAAD